MEELKGKVAVITGGASGIGKAIVTLFAKQGAEVHVLDLNLEQATTLAEELNKLNLKVQAHACDVTSQKEVERIFQEIKHVDVLVNNAGIAHVGKLEDCQESDFDKVCTVNIKGAYNVLYAAIPLMKSNENGGAIVNMASIAAWVGIPDRFVYSLTKGAVAAMTLSIARDYIHENIRCNSISPARVHTPFVDGFIAKNYPGKEKEMFDVLSKTQPIGRMATPDEIAELALYLCSDRASFISGNDYPIDGGFIKLNN
ncbi:MAG TPA: SDR family oxidoreductase [Candidatus Sphingobacterium stercoripullorum]|nr:SDR family oxidoreductase [Candidatus Sphingobacterium stercoripullorum]